MIEDSKPAKPVTLGEMAEDASGFGLSDFRLTQDLILKPGAVQDAYDTHGGTGGGRYPRPMRYYIALNGFWLLVTALMGGYETMLAASPFDLYQLWGMGESSGKDRAEFMADLEQWLSLLSLPVMTLILAVPLYWAISKWSPLDWRHDLNQTVTFLNAWTLYQMPFGLLMFVWPKEIAGWSVPAMLAVAVVAYVAIGRKRWWRTTSGAIGKGVLLCLMILFLMLPASLASGVLALMGAAYAP